MLVTPLMALAQNECHADKLRAIAKKEGAKLACRARAAKDGDSTLVPLCDANADSQFWIAFAKAGACSGDVSVCDDTAEDCVAKVAAALPSGGPDRCAAGKLKAAGKNARAKVLCQSKVAKTGDPTSVQLCVAKAEGRLFKAFAKADLRGPCAGLPDDISSLINEECVEQAMVLDQVGDVAALCPSGSPPTTTTATTTTTVTTITTTTSSTTTSSTTPLSTTTTTWPPGVIPKDSCSSAEIVLLAGSEIDYGWNGAGHNKTLTEGTTIRADVVRRCNGDRSLCLVDADCPVGETCDLTCDCDGGIDTTCEITGPVGNGRCLVATHKTCTTNADCTAVGDGGQCVAFYGPPLPLSAEGTPTCVTNYFQGDITGTLNTATGGSRVSASARSRVHLGITLSAPCSVCGSLAQSPVVGDLFTCSGGPRNGQPCTVGAVNPLFGGTSLDCPPDANSNVSGIGLAIRLSNMTTGTDTVDATLPCGGSLAGLHPSNGSTVCLDTFASCSSNADCMRCTEDPTTACTSNADCTGVGTCAEAPEQPIPCGIYCHCGFCDGDPDAPCFSDAECGAGETCEQGSGATQQLQPSQCTDLTCGLGGFEQCCSSGEPGCANPTALVGECVDQPFRGCSNNTDCTNAGATGPCSLFNRPCFENRIARTGTPAPLASYCTEDPNVTACASNADCAIGECVPDSAEPTTVALFCVPPTASASINAGHGVPGPAAIQLKTAIRTYRCGDGAMGGTEQCDDGNNTSGDGCDEACRVE